MILRIIVGIIFGLSGYVAFRTEQYFAGTACCCAAAILIAGRSKSRG